MNRGANMRIKNLGLKVSLIVALMITVIICITYFAVSNQSNDLIMDLVAKEAEASNISFAKEMEKLQLDALTRARIIAYSHDFVDALLANDESAIKDVFDHYGEGLDLITVCDTNGNVIMRSHSDLRGDNVMNQHALSVALSPGHDVSTIEKGTVVGLSTRGSATIRDHSGNIIGAIVCGHDLSSSEYVDAVRSYTGSEVTIFDGDTRLMTSLTDEKGARVVGTKASDTVISTVLNQKKSYSQQVTLFGHEYYAFYSPIITDEGAIGMLFTGVPIDAALAEQRSMVSSVLLIGIICGLICVLMIIVFSLFAVSRPLKKIGAFAEKIESGDLGISSASTSKVDVRSSDEVGVLARTLERAYAQMQGYVGEISERMHGLAEGDLSTESSYDFQGDFVLIKDSINEHVRNLNHTMAEINSSSSQVSSGAKQVADGAQSLAQGSTEQAAAIEELSSSISEIAEKTKANATTANKTSSLSATIKENAEKGSHQMDEMITAVRDINEASKNIGKIIKTIDDIAFQTNILALNAAVEAARAGQAGKGFAVVAEEVRNLASKSAEAAKDTGDMIQNSMDKAELGARIAGDTATSLSEIVNGINESSQLIAEIARSSEEQSLGIGQINTGIDQVAQVIQQNSATAEESAAASQEMSGQSDILQQLLTQFKLDENMTGNRNLLSSEKQGRKRLAMPEKSGYTSTGNNMNFGKY